MSEPSTSQDSLLQTLHALVRDLPLMLSDRVELFSLELQRAGSAFARIVVMGVAAAVAGATAWLLLWALVVQSLLRAGLPWWAALLVPLAVNAAAAWWAVTHARRLTALLKLPATRRHLTVSPSIKPPSPAPAAANPSPVAPPHDVPAQPAP